MMSGTQVYAWDTKLYYNAWWLWPNIFNARKCQISRRFLAKKCRISRNFLLLFFEPPTPLTWNKAYLRYPMSLTVILLLIVMLTAGPDRLYRVARSHVQLYIARTDCIFMDNGTAPAPLDPGLLRLQTVSWSYMSGWLGRDATNMLRAICETVHFVGSLIAQFVKFLCVCLFPELGNWKFAQFPNWTNFVYKIIISRHQLTG